MKAQVRAVRHQVARCWHPDARGEVFDMPNGSMVAVLVGAPAYQLSTGETINL
ncbi:MAG: hypothetical protein V4508_02300 [Pseudomonadota bacterium]